MSRRPASASVYHAIAGPTRRRLLTELTRGARTVTALQRVTGAGQSALSQHLAVLRRARLVTHRREGRHRWYAVRRPTPLKEVADWLDYFERFWDEKLPRLGAYLERRT